MAMYVRNDIVKHISVVLCVSTFMVVQAESINDKVYQQELKALKKARFHQTILDRHSNMFLRNILSNVENAKDLNLFHRILRGSLLMQGVVTVTSKSMPKLYSYIDIICRKHSIKTPTVFITINKNFVNTTLGKFFDTASVKVLWSSGAILIGQDLVRATSDKALDAAIAYEIGHIKYNHTNKEWLVTTIISSISKIIEAELSNRGQNILNRNQVIFYNPLLARVIGFILPRLIIGKQFEKQADKFAYEITNNAQGFIEFCQYLQEKEDRNERDYKDTYASLQKNSSKIAFLDYVFLVAYYHCVNGGHRLYNGFKWVCHHIPLIPYQSVETRLKAAQRYIKKQETIVQPT